MAEQFQRVGLISFCRAWLRNREFARFLIVGGVNTALTYAIYVGLVLFLPYPVAYTVTTAIGIFISYVLNAQFVFNRPLSLSAALQYPVVYLVQYLMGLVLLYFLIDIGHLSKFVAPILVVIATVPVTYLLSRFVLRGRLSRKPTSRPEPRLQ